MKPLRQQHFEHLRLVSDDLWYGAQTLLAESQEAYPNAGRKPVDGNTVTRPRILNGLLYCYHHDCRLKVGGDDGKHMVCMRCRTLPKTERPLYSYLNRREALRGLCLAIAEAIRNDADLVDRLLVPFTAEAESLQTDDTSDLDRLQRQFEKLSRQIQFTLDNPGDTEADERESRQRLKDLRGERSSVSAEIAQRQARRDRPKAVPTAEEFRNLLVEIDRMLLDAAHSDEPADAGALRTLLELITSGKIVVEQAGERRHNHGWPRLRFTPRLLEACWSRLCIDGTDSAALPEIVVELRPVTIAERNQREVIRLYQAGMLITAIATKLEIDRHQVSEAAEAWCEANGVPFEDGRVRRAKVPDKLLNPPKFQQLAEEAKRLLDEDLLIEQIAERLGCIRDTVRAALRFWFTSRGLPMPDMRNRRKTMAIKNRPKEDRKD